MLVKEVMAAQQIGFPILTVLIALPILVALGLQVVKSEQAVRRMAAAGALLELALAILAAVQFVPNTANVQFAEHVAWMPTLGSSYHLGVDGISILFLPMTALLTVMILAFSWQSIRISPRFYLGNLFFLQAMTMGIFCSLDLLLFFVFWELALLPSYFLIKLWGVGPQRHYASLKYVIYMLVGSAPLLVGIIMLGMNHSAVAAAAGTVSGPSFDYLMLLKAPIPAETQTIIFVLMMIGFAVKAPLPPFHTWMPSTLIEGPIGIGIFLVGLKLGTYGMLRFVLPLLPDASRELFSIMVWIGVAATLYGGLIALTQSNIRRLLAFASVAHVGLVVAGLFSLTVQGMQGALFLMINIALTATTLLFLSGALYARVGSSDLPSFGGLARHVPKLATFFFIIGLASIGMPGTSGFTAEFLLLTGVFQAGWQFAAIIVLGVILSAGYFLWYFERAFFGPVTNSIIPKLADLAPREFAVGATATALVLWMGLYPAPLVSRTAPSLEVLAQRLKTGSAVTQSGPETPVRVTVTTR